LLFTTFDCLKFVVNRHQFFNDSDPQARSPTQHSGNCIFVVLFSAGRKRCPSQRHLLQS
jgi:hypothetical protein